MNSQERDLLTQLLKQLAEVKLTAKDAEAESLIQSTVAHQPDALYLLVQRALLLEHALNTTKAQNADLQAQLHNNPSGQQGSLLGNNPWAQVVGNINPAPVAGSRQSPQYAAQSASNLFGGGSSFLGSVATTAAGVVAGSFLFNGIENLMGHHSSGFDQHAFNDSNSEPTTVTNNYYGDSAEQLANNNNDTSNDFQASNDTDSFQDDTSDSDWT